MTSETIPAAHNCDGLCEYGYNCVTCCPPHPRRYVVKHMYLCESLPVVCGFCGGPITHAGVRRRLEGGRTIDYDVKENEPEPRSH